MMHRKYGSKDLIDSFANIGLCASYDETKRFEASILHDPQNHTCFEDTYIQYAFDNADHNTCTIDGKNTFHAMGGIKIATPADTVTTKHTIARLEKLPKANAVGTFGFIPLQIFDRKASLGLKKIKIMNVFEADSTESCTFSMADFIWLFSKYSNNFSKGWNSYMEEFHSESFSYNVSKIIPLPFVNNPPSSYDTIFTVLAKAAYDNNDKQSIVFVTFDQPLYLKACEILACQEDKPVNVLSCIRAKLGGFHMAMSFLGSAGFIMDGSGLKEALSTIYASNSADKALTGHAYSRAIRGHFLVQVALCDIIFSSINFDDVELAHLQVLLESVGTSEFSENVKKKKW